MSGGSSMRPEARTIGGVVREMAARLPLKPAVLYDGAAISFAELESNIRAAAKGLLALGVRPGERVGVLLGNDPDWLTVSLGALTIGAICVPLNTWYKARELEWTIRHCGLSVLVSTTRFLKHDYGAVFDELIPELRGNEPGELRSARFPALRALAFAGPGANGVRWEELLRGGARVSDEAFEQAARSVSPEDSAFLLYTSGSTAEPKGVLLRHDGVVENGFDIGERRWITEEDRVWLGAPLFYGLGATNALPATLTHGAALVLQDYFEAGRAIETIRSTQATVYYGAGAGNMSQAILEHPSYTREKISTLDKGNAGMIAEYKRMTIEEMGIRHATGSYGLTEAYGHATGHLPDDPLAAKLHTNGTPLPGFTFRIVDPQTRRPCDAGETGLVLLRGHITPGYYQHSGEVTAVVDSEGFFDTGDLGSIDRHGNFVYHSRLKDVMKSGGINVSPLEVEQLIAEHPSVRNAYVVGVPHPSRGEVIVAFVDARGVLREDEVKEFMRERTSSFKVPHHVLFRSEDAFPRLASGKVAKHQLVGEALAELTTHESGDEQTS